MNCIGLLLLVVPCFVQCQVFEGKIIFKNSYEWKADDGLTTEQFTMYMGDMVEYYFKGSFYKSISNGMYYNEQTYSPKENKLYNLINGSDTLIWINGAINSDTIVNYSIEDSDEVIFGFKCKLFKIETTQGTSEYYFSNEFKLNPDPYVNHHYGNFSLVTSETLAHSLKIIIKNKYANMIFEAVGIEEIKLEDSFFEVPDLPSKEILRY